MLKRRHRPKVSQPNYQGSIFIWATYIPYVSQYVLASARRVRYSVRSRTSFLLPPVFHSTIASLHSAQNVCALYNMLFVPGRLPLLVIWFELLFRFQENWGGEHVAHSSRKEVLNFTSEQMSKKNKPHTSRAISSFFNPLIQPTFTRDVANENPQNQFSQILPIKISHLNHILSKFFQAMYAVKLLNLIRYVSQVFQPMCPVTNLRLGQTILYRRFSRKLSRITAITQSPENLKQK